MLQYPMPLEDFHDFLCPYCSQPNTLTVDLTGGAHQDFTVDCEVCCAPVAVRLTLAGDRVVAVKTERENA
jgi:hypothetical protein